ncbi:vgr related protein [Polymorphobacter sp.]|uniref:vgr related protein n=1 Tax=Polymorphobacter sp. TaxID=1909290 RepID=UPI003F717516
MSSQRPLTRAETALVASVFGPALDPAPVTIRRRKWFWLQPRHITMAPDGHIWCHPEGSAWQPCFATQDLLTQAFFIHEMTHVWQHQSGINLILRRLPFARYRYTLVPGKPLRAYGIEQQACIVADAFLARAHIRRQAPLATYAALLPFEGWRG